MTDFRKVLKKSKLIRSFVYRLRTIIERHSYNFGHNTITIKSVRVKTLVQVRGDGNTVDAFPQSVLKRAKIFIQGNNNKVIIKESAYLEGTVVHIEDNNCLIEIGEHTFVGPSHLACTENDSCIIIGKNCMFSSNIYVRTGDSHSIIDNNGNRINPAASVIVGDHCWIGEGAKIMKGVHLQNDTIVASGAIVTRSFSSNCILAGNPAKVIRENVNWDKHRF